MIRLTALVLALGSCSALAAPLLFDPTGTDVGGTYSIDQLDWSPSGVLARGGNLAIANYLNGNPNTGFQVLTHATLLGGSLGSTGVFTTTGAGYEITAVLGFGERVIGATLGNGITTKGTADFAFDPSQPTFIRIYYATSGASSEAGAAGAKDANMLQGTGYNNGHLLFSSTLTTVGGSFSSLISPSSVNLDLTSDGNQWDGQKSVTGFGANTPLALNVATPTFIDTDFFRTTPLLQFLIENVSLNAAFTTTNPSYGFTQLDNMAYTVTANGGVSSTLGTLNGGLNCPTGAGSCVPSGPDFMFSTDVNSSIQAQIPEPGALALLGLGLAGLGFSRRRG